MPDTTGVPELTEAQQAALAAIDALYAQMPSMQCKGLCASACVQVEFSPLERLRLGEAGAAYPRFTPETRGSPCAMLTAEGRCSVYAHRPGVCRIWGATEHLRCPHGCEPADGMMPSARAMALTMQAALIGESEVHGVARADQLAQRAGHVYGHPLLAASMRRQFDGRADGVDLWQIARALDDVRAGVDPGVAERRIRDRARGADAMRRRKGMAPPDLPEQIAAAFQGREFETAEAAAAAFAEVTDALLPARQRRPPPAPLKGRRTKKRRRS